MAILFLIAAFSFFGISTEAGRYDPYEGKEAWGYVNVRKDAYMFWWLFYTDAPGNYENYPLIIWHQGGPGASSVGFGNFEEIGPYDVHLNPRNTTWVKKANVLFLDSPVGTGFSYVNNKSALAKTNAQIADDLVFALTSILETVPEFQKAPLYIFGESYGGKVVVDFSLALYKAVKAQKLTCNFKGLTLVDSWISPIDSVSTWGQYLYTMSLLDKTQLQNVNVQAKAIEHSLAVGQSKNASVLEANLQASIEKYTADSISWYNILRKPEQSSNQSVNKFTQDKSLNKLYDIFVKLFHGDPLTTLMNGKIREKLHVIPKNVTWGSTASDVFEALSEDFMKPVVNSVDALLNQTLLSFNVLSGQLDLICDTLGTLQWVEKLKWPGIKGFMNSPKKTVKLANSDVCSFTKHFKQFSFFWVLKSGHMVPADAGECALQIVDTILPKK